MESVGKLMSRSSVSRITLMFGIIFYKDMYYLRDRNDLSHNNSKFGNSTSALPTILALASGTADYKIKHSKLNIQIPMPFPPPIMPNLKEWYPHGFIGIGQH